MRRSVDRWKRFLTEIGLPSPSTIETYEDYTVITVWTDTRTEIDSDRLSNNLAKDIFLGTEVSRVLLNPQGGGAHPIDATFISERDRCAIRFFSPTPDDVLMLKERFPQIDWGVKTKVSIFSLLREIVGSDLARKFLLSDTTAVCLRRICELEKYGECRKFLPQHVENSYHEPWCNPSSEWELTPRKG